MYGTGSYPLNCDNYGGAIVYAQSFHVDPDYDFNLIPARSVQPASVMRLRETVLLWKQIFLEGIVLSVQCCQFSWRLANSPLERLLGRHVTLGFDTREKSSSKLK